MIKTCKKILALSTVVAALLASTPAPAADGTLGATSTGTSQITLTIGQRYQISHIADFAFGTYGGSGDMTSNDDVCVYTNDLSRNYRVRITDSSSMSPSGFSVQNAAGSAEIPYTIKWNNATGTSGNQNVNYNAPVSGANANNTSNTCASGGNNANIQVTMASAALQAAAAGAYSATVTIVVEP